MNKLKFLVLFPVLLGLLFSCKDDEKTEAAPSLSIDQAQLIQEFNTGAGSKSVTVTSNREFTATAADQWCTTNIDPEKATGNLTITVTENTGIEARETEITVAVENGPSVKITVKQLGVAPVISVIETKIDVEGDNAEFDLRITANIEFDFELPDWVTLKENSGGVYTFTAGVMPAETDERSGNITVKAKEQGVTATPVVIPVVQKRPEPVYPVANLFDVAFNPTGNGATDYSPYKHSLIRGTSAPRVEFNSTVNNYTATTGLPTDYLCYYKLDYQNNQPMMDAMEKAYSIECYFKLNSLPSAGNLATPVSSQRASAGFGITIENVRDKGHIFTHYAGINSKWQSPRYGSYGLPVIDTYYHVIYTYDQAAGKLTAYMNGQLDIATENSEHETFDGTLNFPYGATGGSVTARWFAIGGNSYPAPRSVDPNSDNTYSYEYINYSFKGEIVFARLYDKAVNSEEAALLYQQITDRKSMTKVGDLNTALTVTLPGKTGAGAEELTARGWRLMNSMSTTDADITAFLAEVGNL